MRGEGNPFSPVSTWSSSGENASYLVDKELSLLIASQLNPNLWENLVPQKQI